MSQQPAGTGLTIASREWEAAQAAARAAYSAACFEADQIRDRAYYVSTLRTGAAMPSDADMMSARVCGCTASARSILAISRALPPASRMS